MRQEMLYNFTALRAPIPMTEDGFKNEGSDHGSVGCVSGGAWCGGGCHDRRVTSGYVYKKGRLYSEDALYKQCLVGRLALLKGIHGSTVNSQYCSVHLQPLNSVYM